MKMLRIVLGAKLSLAILALAALCVCAVAQESSADDWVKKGRSLMGNLSYQEALSAYDEAIEIDPENADAWMSRADSLWFLKRPDEAKESATKALQLYNESLERDPENLDHWIGKAHVFSSLAWRDSAGPRDANLESALQAYDRALQIQPQNSSVLALQGGVLYELGRYEWALQAFDKAQEIGFSSEDDWRWEALSQMRGLALAALGRDQEASESYQNALVASKQQLKTANSTKEQVDFWTHQGILLQEQGNLEDALSAFNNATALDPESAFSWKVKGFMLAVWMGRYDEGLAALDRGLEIEPSADVWEIKGRVLNELGSYNDALNASNEALQLNKNFTRAFLVKGHALRELGRYQEALDAYEEAENTYDEQLWGERGFALTVLNRSDEAALAFERSLNVSTKVLERDNKSAYAWFWKGEALRGLGRYQEALEAYDRSLEIGPEKAISAWRGKGDVLKALGHQSEADEAFAKARELGYQG